jgi:hypothetical protein
MTLVAHQCPAQPKRTSVRIYPYMSAGGACYEAWASLGRDAGVTPVALITGLAVTARRFAGIVTAWLGKTAREGGKRMALMGHAEEQCRHVT